MSYSADCIACTIRKNFAKVESFLELDKRDQYMREVLRISLEAPDGYTPTDYVNYLDDLYEELFGYRKDYTEVKEQFNTRLLVEQDYWQRVIDEAEDSVLTAMKISRAGNYIDPSTVGNPDPSMLRKLIEEAVEEPLDAKEYANFRDELSRANRLIFLTDNAGEIVLDKLLIRALKKAYPNLPITVVVRGEKVLNDATMEDAELVGLTDEAEVIGNGSDVAGTRLEKLDPQVREMIEKADVILAKGQGNAETLMGCGLNIYFSFLCKCDFFVRRFKTPLLKGAFVNERRRGAGTLVSGADV